MTAAPTLWLTGLSGAGKTTLALALQTRLRAAQIPAAVLDGDELRRGPHRGLGFSDSDREENVRRTAAMSKLLNSQGILVIASLISPTHKLRALAREWVGENCYVEVFVDTPLSVCAQRDVKGLYARAQVGELHGFTGVSAPYERPLSPCITVRTDAMSVDHCVATILQRLPRPSVALQGHCPSCLLP